MAGPEPVAFESGQVVHAAELGNVARLRRRSGSGAARLAMSPLDGAVPVEMWSG